MPELDSLRGLTNQPDETYAAGASGLGLMAGGGAMLDPRSTYYHGTDPETAEKIKQEGFRRSKNVSNAYDNVNRSWVASPQKYDIAEYHADEEWADANTSEGKGDELFEKVRNSDEVKGDILTVRIPTEQMDYIKTDHVGDGHSLGVASKIEPKHIVESDDYKYFDTGEVAKHIKNTTKGKAGLGLGVAGLGALGYGSYEAMKKN